MGEAAVIAAVAIATGAFACLVTRALIPVLQRRGILAHPNERSSHHLPTPRGGGIAVICSVMLAWVVLARWGLVRPGVGAVSLGAGILGIVSWIDDRRELSPLPRLLAQAAAVAIGSAALPEPSNLDQGWPASVVWFAVIGLAWVWWINLFNFMDGIDGIAGSEAAAIGVGLVLFATVGAGADPALALLAAAIAGAAIGFLIWNWAPARIFLGDFSAPLGYLLGFLLLEVAIRGHWKIALILPLYFLADATITLSRRLARGARVWHAHREHFYQLAVRGGVGHAAVVERVIAADLVLVGCGWAAENGWAAPALAASIVTVAGLMVALGRGPLCLR